jgi:hypothetical protein
VNPLKLAFSLDTETALVDAFVAERKAEAPGMTWETEMITRFAYRQGLATGHAIGLEEGTTTAQSAVRAAIGLDKPPAQP